MTTFDSTKRSLPDLLKDLTNGKIQLPDFQRGWVWDDEHVKSLLDWSVSPGSSQEARQKDDWLEESAKKAVHQNRLMGKRYLI